MNHNRPNEDTSDFGDGRWKYSRLVRLASFMIVRVGLLISVGIWLVSQWWSIRLSFEGYIAVSGGIGWKLQYDPWNRGSGFDIQRARDPDDISHMIRSLEKDYGVLPFNAATYGTAGVWMDGSIRHWLFVLAFTVLYLILHYIYRENPILLEKVT